MNRVWLFLPVVLVVVLGVMLYAGIGKDPTKLDSARLNQPVPAFELTMLADAQRMLDNESLKGQVALFNVWGTWCPSCRVEHPYLVALAEEQGIRIIGLNYKDKRGPALRWLEDLGDPYQFNIYDPEGSLGYDLGVYGAPETYVLDANGVVRYRHVGVVDERVWENHLKPVYEQYRAQEVD
ncbi:MAG: DsbE family thiol:disulfide interchange protein [Oleiphilaceae bacterium]|nr:DsbE family thiol:disulfide interchange protein [Oleiphilaceae bacterium]